MTAETPKTPKEIRSDLLDYATRFEQHLISAYGATGRGIHGLLNSVEGKLHPTTVKRLRQLADVRNEFSHKHNFEVQNAEILIKICKHVEVDFGLDPLHTPNNTVASPATEVTRPGLYVSPMSVRNAYDFASLIYSHASRLRYL